MQNAFVLFQSIMHRWRVWFRYGEEMRDAAPHALYGGYDQLQCLGWDTEVWQWRVFDLKKMGVVRETKLPWVRGLGYVRPDAASVGIIHIAV